MTAEPIAWANTFALVSYIPRELGLFLDELRKELVPNCAFHSHVTVLPPRSLQGPVEQAIAEVREHLKQFRAFSLCLDEVEVFPRTSVLYLGIGEGRNLLIDMHARMNHDTLEFPEPYPFHPHVTLAQDFPVEQVTHLHGLAQKRWAEWRQREFAVETLTFVRRRVDNTWANLAECVLEPLALSR